MGRSNTAYRRPEVEEFDRKLRRFNETLAHRERRMLREIIEAALADDDDMEGYAALTDDQLFVALTRILAARDETATV